MDNLGSPSVLSRETIRPLALVAMRGYEEMGNKVNNFLLEWSRGCDDEILLTFPGYNENSFLLEAECPRFGTGEGKGIIHNSVRGRDVFILCDVTNYRETYRMYGEQVPMSPDDHFQDLKRLLAAAGRKPYRISVIMPYLYEGRQHRRVYRESLDGAIALRELDNLGVSNIIAFDAHDPRVQNAVPYSNFDNIQPTYQMLKRLLRRVPDLIIDKEHMMIVSPDEGAAPRNIFYASVMGLDLSIFYKRRDYSVVINGRNPIVAHEYLGDSVEGKDVLIADDILSTGESLLDLARELKRRKAKRVFFAATYALFTEGYSEFEKAYNNGLFDLLLSTNLTYLEPKLKNKEWFAEVDMSKYIAILIATLNHDSSISSLLDPSERIQKLLDRHNKK